MSFTSNFLNELEKRTGGQTNAGGTTPPAASSGGNYTQNFLQELALRTPSANPSQNRKLIEVQKALGKTVASVNPEKNREQAKIQKTVNSFAWKQTMRKAKSAADAAEKEYEDFLKSEEYVTMQDSKRMHQFLVDAGIGWASGYDPLKERELNTMEQTLRRKAEQLRGVADSYKEQEIYDNAESLAEKAEKELETYLHSEEYAAWQIARDKWKADTDAIAQITGNPVAFPSVWDKNDREQQLRATAEYYRQVATSKKEQAMMEADLQELAGWSQAEQEALKVYALGAYQTVMGRPEEAAAFTAGNSPEELFRKYGPQRVKEIAESYMRSQSQGARQMVATAAQEGAGSGFWAGAGHSVASVGANLAGSLTAPLGYLAEAAGRTGRYSTLDPNNPGQILGTYAGAVRQEVAGNIQNAGFGKAGATVYQAGMSALDNLARMVAGGGAGSLALAAMGSFGQAVSQYSAQGATPLEAVAMGIINGGLEVLTEKISLDNILDEMATPKTGMQMLKAALRAGGIEVTEEEMSFLGSALAEAAVLREKSGYQQQVAMLKAFGLSEAAAKEQAARGVIDEAWQTAVQSFLSGGMMSGATSLYSKAVNKAQEKQLKGSIQEAQQKILSGENTGSSRVMIREGTEVSEEIRAQAERISGVTGRQIEMYGADSGEDGFYDKNTGILHINAKGKDPFAQIVSHELTHSVEMSDAYKDISSLVMKRIQQQGRNLEQLRQEKRALYAKNGIQLQDDAEVDSEIVATYIARNLLTNEQEITSLARENPTVAQKVRDWLDSLLAKLGSSKAQERTFVKKARDAYARALEQTGGKLNQEGTGMPDIADMMELKEWVNEQLRSGEWTEEQYEAFLDEYEQYMNQAGVDPMAREDQRFGIQRDADKKFSFAGENSKTADKGALARAMVMKNQGADNETIRKETGWFQGMEGKWRYEIDDSQMKYHRAGDAQFTQMHEDYARHQELYQMYLYGDISQQEIDELERLDEIWGRERGRLNRRVENGDAQLQNIIRHDALFEAYPELRGMKVRFENMDTRDLGRYYPRNNLIVLNSSLRGAPQETLLHEIQHAIQKAEGFAQGSNPSYWDKQVRDGKKVETAGVREAERRVREFEDDPQNADIVDLVRQIRDAAEYEDYGTMDDLENQIEELGLSEKYRQYDDLLMEMYGQWSRAYNMVPSELYRNTAGEIEARNVSGRRNLTAEERKKTPPQLGDENTVFADMEQRLESLDAEYGQADGNYQDRVIPKEEVEEGIQQVAVMAPVVTISGEEFAKGEKDLITQVSEYFDSLNNVAHNDQLGDVVLDRVGVKSDIGHGIGRKKAASFAAVKSVIENGRVVDYQINWKGRGYDTAVVAAPIMIGTQEHMAVVIMIRSRNTNRFYVHEVMATENGAMPFKTGALKEGKPSGDAPSAISILKKILAVKNENKNGASQVPDGNAPSRDVQNELAFTPNDTVSDGGVGVNRKYSFSDQDNAGTLQTELYQLRNQRTSMLEADPMYLEAKEKLRYANTFREKVEARKAMNAAAANIDTAEIDQRIEELTERIEEIRTRDVRKHREEQEKYSGTKTAGYTTMNDTRLRTLDNEYQRAVESGDTDRIAELVEQAAEAAMPNSVVRDKSGRLLKTYHHTGNTFTVFDRDMARTGTEMDGFFFAPDPDSTREYGPNMITAYLNITQLAVDPKLERKFNDSGTLLREKLAYQGYDGVARTENGEIYEYMTFDPEQIKSADPIVYDDSGRVIPLSERFNFKNNDIRYAISEKTRDEAQHKPINREELPAKARKYLESAERGLMNHIGKALGVPYHAKRDTLKPMIQQLSDEYLSSGTISQESMDRLFEEAYEAGVVIDREFYDQYKHVKDHLRATAVTISQQDQADIADFQDFRRRSFGTLRITKEGGIPVDSYYRELQEMAPELFPDHITHPADQLQRMLEVGQSIRVTEGSLDSYYGKYAQEYKAWQKNDFIAAIHDDLAELRTVQRYAQEKNQFEREGEEISVEEAAECWAQLKAARRNYEKVNAKNLLSMHDEMQVGRLLRGEILLEHLEGEENFKGIKAIYEAKQEYEKIAKQIGRYKHQVRRKRLDRADELLKTANDWKDKKTGIQYSRETMRRNILDIVPDQAVAAEILKEYFEPVQHAEALSTKFKTEYRDKVRALNLNTKVTEGNEVSEAYAVQLLGEAMDNIRVMENARGRIRTRDGRTLTEWRALVQDMWEHSPNLDRAKIEGAVREFRKIYDELFQKMNKVRMENGYEPVNYRQGYFPHFQPSSDGDGIIAHFGKVLGIDTNVDALPTTINGLTHTFKPGIQWFGNAQQRLGFKTAYDAVEGFDKYIEGVSSVIHHTENIQKLRALATQARYRTSDEGIREQVDAVQMDTRLTDEERQLKIQDIYEKGKFALSNFVAELDEYTNLLANKKSRFDRTMESFMGRRAYTIMKNVESRVAANMIAGNISSAVTNFIPLTQAMGRIGSTELLRGMKDARRAIIGGTSDFVGRSDFLTNRRGSDVLVKGWSDKLSSKLGMPMELIDNFTSEAIVRAAYYQNVKRGMSESEAIHDADILAASIMADRSKGAMPTLFESRNPLFKAMTQFQLEVNNQYSEIFKDVPREYAEQAKWVLALGFMKYFIAAFLFNELEEKIKGRRSALDPIGIARDFAEDWRTNGLGDAGANLTVNLLEGMPFSSALNLLGIDIDGGRVAVASAIPDIPALWQALTDKDMSGAERWDTAVDELQKPIVYLALPVGGNQLSKTWKGVAAYLKGGSYGLNGDGEEIMQYPVYKDEGGDAFWSLVKSMVFGKNSLGTAQDWVNSGFSSLNAKQTAVYQDMLEAGAKDRDAYELIDAIRNTPKPGTEDGGNVQRENRMKLIRESGLSGECKDIAYYGMIASDSERELMDALADAGATGGISEFVSAYSNAKLLEGDAERVGLRDVICESSLTEEEKQVVMQNLLGRDEVNENGNLTKYGKYVYAMEQGMSTDDYMELYARNVSVDEYLDMMDTGLSDKGAMDLTRKLAELDTKDMTSTQKWKAECDAIMAAGLSERDQVAALVSVSYESTGRMFQVGYDHGIEPSLVLDFKRTLPDFDDNSNGSYSQKEVTAAIDAIAGNEVWLALTGGRVNLTNEQKAVLWQLQNSSWKPNKNPYDKEVGQYIYDLVKQMKEK